MSTGLRCGIGSQVAPSEFFSDVVGPPLGVELDFVGGVGLGTAGDLLAGRDDERMIATRADPRRVLAARYRRANFRPTRNCKAGTRKSPQCPEVT